ncbi:MAG: FAD-dependent monooxygenase [Flavobacteriales bacterium]|jgi:2-polyprenyl-6-methoxyphenol hydroxylase-like FAD-dependent oxidoreductase|nr:FAD-dependent monooxygenase [Flavobacteriales bacterium]
MEKVTIIGAGIAGLTLGIALQKKGIAFEIYEAFDTVKDLGAGIMLANNAMQVYQKLGLTSEIAAKGREYHALNIVDGKMNILSSMGANTYSEHKIESYAIHRSTLQQVLLKQVPTEKLHLGKKVAAIEKQAAFTIVKFHDGTQIKASVLIGADGIHSEVRQSIGSKNEIRNAHQICWRGIANIELPKEYTHQLHEIWADGKRFGFVQIATDKVYWYALKDSKQRETITIKELLVLFQNFHPVVNKIIAQTDGDKLLTNEMLDLKPLTQWFQGNICLIGDAAHATTPNMGQGACQSIEDAYVLSEELAKTKNIQAAFLNYQNHRIQKANKVTNMSWKIGKVSHYTHPIFVAIRNFLLKQTPEAMIKKQNEFLFKL